MSQVFSGDSVSISAAGTIPTSGETILVQGNFLNPPFGNAKAVVIANVVLTPGTGTTSQILRLRRNPNAENLQVGGSGPINVTAGSPSTFSFQAADVIPDGRAVQYALTVSPTGASATGTITAANIATFLISG